MGNKDALALAILIFLASFIGVLGTFLDDFLTLIWYSAIFDKVEFWQNALFWSFAISFILGTIFIFLDQKYKKLKEVKKCLTLMS